MTPDALIAALKAVALLCIQIFVTVIVVLMDIAKVFINLLK